MTKEKKIIKESYLQKILKNRFESFEQEAIKMDDKSDFLFDCHQTFSISINNLKFKPEYESPFEGKSIKLLMSNRPFDQDE